MAAEGTANLQVQAEGNIDVRGLLRNTDSELKLKLIPSANIEVSGRLTLDALVVESGLKVISTLYTASGGDLTLKTANNKHGFDIKFGLPIQEQKILGANHEIVFHSRDQAGHETNTPLKFAQQKDFSICIDQFTPFIGLAFCADLNGPNLAGKQTPVLPFPLAGDAKLAVYVQNEDVSYYHVKGSVNNELRSVEFLAAAIGKNNNEKKTEFIFKAELSPDKYIKIVLDSPLKAAYAEGRITNTQNEKSVMAKFGHDQMEFYGKLGISISGPSNKIIYKPILEYKAPSNIQVLPVKLEGQLIAEESNNGKKFTFDNAKLILPNGQNVVVNGNFGAENQAFFSDIVFAAGQASANLKGTVSVYCLCCFN